MLTKNHEIRAEMLEKAKTALLKSEKELPMTEGALKILELCHLYQQVSRSFFDPIDDEKTIADLVEGREKSIKILNYLGNFQIDL